MVASGSNPPLATNTCGPVRTLPMNPTLTTPEAFRKYLNANPHDFVAMGGYADCLDEQEPVYVKCKPCGGEGFLITGGRGDGSKFFPFGQITCTYCKGNKEILDRTNTHLAIGYRALSVVRPVYDIGQNCWWGGLSRLPVEWLRELAKKGNKDQIKANSAIEGLDMAVLAFAALPDDHQREILNNGK